MRANQFIAVAGRSLERLRRMPFNARRNGSDRFLVERFSEWLPGWGRRQLTLVDFYELAYSLGIEVVEYPFDRDCGHAFWIGAQPYVYYSSRLPGPEQVITCYHELAHILYHPVIPAGFKRERSFFNFDKWQRQAEIVGVVAWMPSVEYMTAEYIMREYGVSRETASFRAGLNLWPAWSKAA